MGDNQVQAMVARDDSDNIRWVWEEEGDWPGYWRQPSRGEYRGAGNRHKANRPRGGGAKSEWFKEYAKMTRENPQMTKTEIIAILGPCPANQTTLKLGKGD